MNRNLHSPSQLTEFSRDFDEEPETIFSKLVNKLTSAYNNNYNNLNINSPSLIVSSSNSDIPVSSGHVSMTRDENQTASQPSVGDSNETGCGSINSLNNLVESDSSSDLDSKFDCDEFCKDEIMAENVSDRTPLSVLQRISNLVALRSNNLHSYKDTELQKFWMPDDKSKECYECSVKFSTFRRKHHCRLCGQIFCSKCCNQVVPGKIIKCSDHLKVCTYCSKIVLSYLRSSDLNTDLKSDLQALKEDLSNKLSVKSGSQSNLLEETNSNLYNLNEKRKFSIGYQEERLATITTMGLSNADRKSILQQSNSLKLLHEDMFKNLPNQNRGADLINYLIVNHKSSNKIQAVAILNAMIDAGFLISLIQSPSESVSNEFDESYLYKLLRKDGNLTTLANSNSFQLDLNIESNSVQLSRPNYDSLPSRSTQFSVDMDDLVQEMTECQLKNNLMSSAGSKPLLEGFCDHEETLLEQLLRTENLDPSWNKILIQHCARVANTLRPELCGTQLMDIRHFVNFKKVPGGQRCESTIVGGVVFTKNVVHKEMATRIKNPRILLLQCAIVYQRVEGKLVRIETLLLQEKEYLRNVTARILSLKPNVVLVHKNVSGIAQDMLREHGITLVLDVKQSVLERLALNLQCDIVSSIDSNIGQPKLGVCDLFYIKSFSDGNGILKSLMFFETSSNPRGCCVLLRGGNINELARVKKVASFLLFVRYNWRLELSFLLDEYARPPSPKPSIFDSKEQSPSDDTSLDQHDKLQHQKSIAQLIKKPSIKKSEEKIINKENVQDFSDPLRAEDTTALNKNDNLTNLTVETPYDNRFRTALNSTILTISPNLTFPLPFLETEPGKKCSLRCHFPNEIFYSKQWSENLEKPISHENYLELANIELIPEHEFVRHKITTPIDNREFQTLLANFRAGGGRFPKKTRMKIITKSLNESFLHTPKKPIEEVVYHDALDIYNHQRLPVLFCSYYYNPKTASSFCASPSLLNMSFYGQNDIMLGSFLERYCFRTSYICPSCNLLMLDHIRRYVHSNGCILVALSEESKKGEGTSEIHMYSFCTICQKQTKSVPLSKDTWCLSFAKYLELRFHGHAYKRRNIEDDDHICDHSLHRDYIQYFSYNGICASFEYSSVETWEITLPSLIIKLKPPKPINKPQVIEEIKNFAMKGYEVYAKIYDKLALISSDDENPMMATLKVLVNRDQMIFRSKVEKVHTVMTDIGVTCYDISNVVFMMKRALAESIEIWGPKLHEASMQSQQNLTKIQKTENCFICTEELLHSELENHDENKRDLNENASVNAADGRESVEEIISGSEKTNPNLDKKGIRSLLSQLIPSTTNQNNSIPSPLPSNEYYTLPLGQFPVLIRENDISSIIAYSLISNEYLKLIENLNSEYASDTNNSPHLKRKSQDVSSGGNENTDQPKEASGGEKEKKTKSNAYISISFQDLTSQFMCKIYFPKEFDQLRVNFLKTPDDNTTTQEAPAKHSSFDRKLSNNSLNLSKGREGNDVDEIRRSFVRSLCYSHFWEARGGKSGSKFSKTSDDRFILKEMSKQDVAIFENFAPNYFDYINQCLQLNQPTLLAKILGVFRVTIKKRDSVQDKSILVMENLFCDRIIENKFDLKGSERNRLVDPNNQNGEIVLLDENLIQMSWSKPLYILGHSRTILRQSINRDSSFLEKNGVMDYSLLVGLDKNEKLLVLGIIDYIRTYTLDKKLESLVKQSGLLGGQGKLPTIISPKLYKQRFIEAMDRYFLIVPDRWEGLGKK